MPRTTLKDAAERAQVSISTVSYALNDASHVQLAPETRARVRRIAKELGYTPNAIARSLQGRGTRTVGVVISKPLTNLRYATIVHGIGAELSERGMRMAVLSDPSADSILADCRGGLIEGLVFVGHDDAVPPAALVEAAADGTAPLATIDCGRAPEGATYSSVDFDYASGAVEMVEHLAERGITSVLHLRPELPSRAERERRSALMQALGEASSLTLQVVSTRLDDAHIDRVDRGDQQASAEYRQRTKRALESSLSDLAAPPERVAVLCSWGADVELALATATHRSPGITVAALASGWPSPTIWPGLVYSRLPLDEAGRRAASLLLAELGPEPVHERVLLPPLLDPQPHPGRNSA